MRARFNRAAFTAAILLGPVGAVHAGEMDGFFADLDALAGAGPGGAATVQTGGPPTVAPAQPPVAAPGRPIGAAAPAVSDPLGMDALFDGGGDDRGHDAAPIHSRVVEALPPAPAAAADAKRGDAAPPDIRSRVLAPTPEPLAAPAKDSATGKADMDPEPDVAIKPPAATPPLDPLETPRASGAVEPVAPTLPPLNAAIKAALDERGTLGIRGANARERRKEREAIAFFYAAHGFAPVWSDGGHPVAAAEPVLARLARAGEDALSVPAPPRTLATDGTPDAIAASEIALTDAVVAYARQATGSRVDPRAIGPLIGSKPALADPAEVLAAVAAGGATAGDTLRAFNPTEPRYVALREKLAETRAAHGRPVPAGPSLKAGMRDPRVPARIEGTLIANMEMWRWMPRDLGRDRIEVDVPAFTVTVFHDGVPAAHNRVVVGKLDTPTPLFSNTMKFLIVNPVWNVPESIIDKELLRKDGDASGIRARGFDVSYRDGRLVVKQPSGEKNALGRVKFMFPNDYSVYLHDTPSKALFSTSRRAYSHGCVRVDQPFDFAESVLNDGVADGGKASWSQERLRKLLGDKERYVYLPKPLPIHIEYFTATVDNDSQRLQLRDDVYDYAHKVAMALGQEEQGDGVRSSLANARRHPRAIASD